MRIEPVHRRLEPGVGDGDAQGPGGRALVHRLGGTADPVRSGAYGRAGVDDMSAPMASLAEAESPWRRLRDRGPGALSERELLTVLLGAAGNEAEAWARAGALLDRYGDGAGLSAACLDELADATDIGRTRASIVTACFELGRRAAAPDERTQLRGIDDVARIAQHRLAGLRRERIIVLVCDGGNRLRQVVTVSEGSADKAVMPVREVLNAVLRHDGRAFAVAHNHPSGDVEPSAADRRVTREIERASEIVGLRFVGHVVVAGGSWSNVN